MWRGLRANIGSTLSLEGDGSGPDNVIADARYAAWAGGPNSRVSATKTIFLRNIRCIVFGDEPETGLGGKANYFTNGITGNRFDGVSPAGGSYPDLLPNIWGESEPKYGISVEGLNNQLKIGQEGAGQNWFREFRSEEAKCVAIIDANITVENTRFTLLAPSQTRQRWGIHTRSFDGTHTLTINGIGASENDLPTFQNFWYGVNAINQNVRVENAHFLSNNHDVFIANEGFKPLDLVVKNCRMVNYRDCGVTVLGHNTTARRVLVYDNVFVDSRDISPIAPGSPGGFGNRFAVRFISKGGQIPFLAHVQGNEISHTHLENQFYLRGGISMTNMQGVTIEGNYIQNDETEPAFNASYQGISLNGCKSIKLLNNGVFGNGGLLPNFEMRGIQNDASERTTFNCNNVSSFNLGIYFNAQASNNALLTHNEWNANFTDLYLTPSAVIGDQVKGANRWPAMSNEEAYMEWDAFNNGGTYDPSHIPHQLIVKSRGRFQINSPGISDPNDIYWPSPRRIGGVDDLDVWFAPVVGTPPSTPLCYATYWPPDDDPWTPGVPNPAKPSGGDEQVINNTYPPYRGDGWNWDARFRLFGYLKDFPDLRPSGSDAAEWYAAQQNTHIGTLRDIYDGLQNLLALTPSQRQAHKTAYATLVASLQQSDSLVTALQGVLSTSQMDDLRAQQVSNALQVSAQAGTYQALLNSYGSGAVQQANSLLNTLNSLDLSDICEANMQEVLRIQLVCVINNTAPTQPQRAVLESIADKCLYTGGWAVKMARLMLSENIYTDEDGCGSQRSSQKSAVQSSAGAVKVFPNPVRDVLRIQVSQAFEEAMGRIYDAQGNLIKAWAFTQEVQELTDLRLLSGMYYLTIVTDGAVLPARSFTVVH